MTRYDYRRKPRRPMRMSTTRKFEDTLQYRQLDTDRNGQTSYERLRDWLTPNSFAVEDLSCQLKKARSPLYWHNFQIGYVYFGTETVEGATYTGYFMTLHLEDGAHPQQQNRELYFFGSTCPALSDIARTLPILLEASFLTARELIADYQKQIDADELAHGWVHYDAIGTQPGFEKTREKRREVIFFVRMYERIDDARRLMSTTDESEIDHLFTLWQKRNINQKYEPTRPFRNNGALLPF